MAAVYKPPPPQAATNGSYSHAVSRSAELVSCAKTAVKIAQKQNAGHPNPPDGSWWTIQLSDLHLYNLEGPQQNNEVLEDGLSLLRTMEAELKHLESLVRRRGHTNDPTQEITLSVKRLETDTQELLHLIQTMVPPTARGQRQKHWQMLQKWFQTMATHQSERLKEILKVRGKVVAEQAQRRKQFQASSSSSKANNNNWDSPLFQIQAPPKPVAQATPAASNGSPAPASMNATTNNGSHNTTGTPSPAPHPTSAPTTMSTSAPRPKPRTGDVYSYYSPNASLGGYAGVRTAGYGGSSANAATYAGYGGASTGMRQRKNVASNTTSSTVQDQILVQQQQRATQQRLEEAQQAEKSLAHLSTLFAKMSSLITQQSEVIDKVEDDVEAALIDVSAGQQEITTLYSIKKGNRPLILKIFGLLIFFVIFMRFYKN